MKNNKFNSKNIRKIIREEINAKYGHSLKEHEIIILEAGVIQGIKNVLGGVFGVGDAGAAYVGKKIGNIGTGIEKAVASVKSLYATGKLGPAAKAFNDLFSKTKEAGEELVAMHRAAGKPVPENLKQFNTDAAALAEKEIKAAGAPAAGATTAKPGMGESKPIAINKGPTSLQSNLFKLAGTNPEKKKQITGVLKALGGDLKTGKIPITEAADLVNLKNTVAALQLITDPELFKSVKSEIVKILNNVSTKVNIDQIKSAKPAKTPVKSATPAAAGSPAGTATPAAE